MNNTELKQSQSGLENTNKPDYLVRNLEIEGSPFFIQERDLDGKKGYFVSCGKYQLHSEPFTTFEKAVEDSKIITPQRLSMMFTIFQENLLETLKIQKNG